MQRTERSESLMSQDQSSMTDIDGCVVADETTQVDLEMQTLRLTSWAVSELLDISMSQMYSCQRDTRSEQLISRNFSKTLRPLDVFPTQLQADLATLTKEANFIHWKTLAWPLGYKMRAVNSRSF